MVGKTTTPTSGVMPFPTSAPGIPIQSVYGGGLTDGFLIKIANADLSLTLSAPVVANGMTLGARKENKGLNRRDTSSPPPIVGPSGTLSMTATILNQMTSISGYGADNPVLTITGLPVHNSLTACTYGNGSSCLDPNTPNTIKMLPGTTLAPGNSMQVALSFTLDGTLPPGQPLTWNFYTHADTNDPDTTNNYASFSAMVGAPVVVQSVPTGLQITVNGGSPQPAPTTVYVAPNSSYTYCAVTPQTVGGVIYSFLSWGGATSSTQNCVTLPLPSGGTVTASFFSPAGVSPMLTIDKSHQGYFAPGQTGAVYQILVGNGGTGATSGQATVTDTVPSGMTLVSLS
jgi:uncharacterized repeat protein (TIGR01451 family)